MDSYESRQLDKLIELIIVNEEAAKKQATAAELMTAAARELRGFIRGKTTHENSRYLDLSDIEPNESDKEQKNIDKLKKLLDTDFEAANKEDTEMPPRFNDGSFRIKNKNTGLMEYRYILNGKLESAYGHTKQECWNLRMIAMTGKAKKKHEPAKKNIHTVETWIVNYYKLFRENALSEKCKKERERQIALVVSSLGKIQLNKLTAEPLQEFINTLNDTPNIRDKILVFIHSCLEKAVKLGYVKHNPCDELSVVKHKSVNYPVIQLAQQRLLLDNLTQPKYRSLFMFCCCTGLRIGEALSAEIDLKNEIVYVTNEDTSTKKHKRQIPIIIERLPDLELIKEISAAGAQTYFKRLFKELGINAVVHSFRVTFISFCSYVGINPKQIQDWAGHRRIETTMDTYAKLIRKDGTSPILEYLKALKAIISD